MLGWDELEEALYLAGAKQDNQVTNEAQREETYVFPDRPAAKSSTGGRLFYESSR